jgi:RNA polymerase sigma-70 factor (sigma-E family)
MDTHAPPVPPVPPVPPGSAGQLAALYQAHATGLIRLAMLMLGGDQPAAEDVVQDAFLGLHRRWDAVSERDRLLAYVRSSVLNGCRSIHRRAAVARKHAPQLARAGADTGPEDAAVDRSELLTAMRSLPPRQREVLVLRYYVDLDVAEVARTLRIAPSAVRSNCSRGIAALGRTLGRDEK